jgi:glycosyltransferase involved in cell wall biosynthesis
LRIAVVTDAWYPQPNGVVRVMGAVLDRLGALGHATAVIAPDGFRTVPCPTYPEIPLALFAGNGVARRIRAFAPDAIHIATEGPLGLAARAFCLRHRLPFTTAYHTKFPEYVHARTRLPLGCLYALMRRFHAPASAVLAPSPSVQRELAARGFANVRPWSHGVDTAVFRPQAKDFLDLPRPVHLYVGRVTVEKNLPAFLDLDLPGSKVVVGSGPLRDVLIQRYPAVHFYIANGDAELARYYAAADAFVFPSRTDTFGLVMLEALACGVPVAAFPVTGPLDVLGLMGAGETDAGVLDEDLGSAARRALAKTPAACRAFAARFSWDAATEEFLAVLQPFDGAARLRIPAATRGAPTLDGRAAP